MARHVVAAAGDIAPGAHKVVTVEGREIGVFNLGGEFFALLNRCPHEGAALCKGVLTSLIESNGPGDYRVSRQGEILRCPWHGWEFDIRTGQSYCDPAKVRVRAYEVSVEHGGRLVEGPYKAETFPVSVDQDYLVLEL